MFFFIDTKKLAEMDVDRKKMLRTKKMAILHIHTFIEHESHAHDTLYPFVFFLLFYCNKRLQFKQRNEN